MAALSATEVVSSLAPFSWLHRDLCTSIAIVGVAKELSLSCLSTATLRHRFLVSLALFLSATFAAPSAAASVPWLRVRLRSAPFVSLILSFPCTHGLLPLCKSQLKSWHDHELDHGYLQRWCQSYNWDNSCPSLLRQQQTFSGLL